MTVRQGKIWIGTSGWVYPHWKKKFYPDSVPASAYLRFFAEHFDTAEVNNSFYRLPTPETYRKWASMVPSDFVFAVKASRFLTHMKKLKEPEDPWQRVIASAGALGDHLGPILLQFPEKWHKDPQRLEEFLEISSTGAHRLAFEFRNQSWFERDIYRLLERFNACLVSADSTSFPRRDLITADFAYYRYHGREQLYAADYSKEDLKLEAGKLQKLKNSGLDVFCYFNNDGQARAIYNAKYLRQTLELPEKARRSRSA